MQTTQSYPAQRRQVPAAEQLVPVRLRGGPLDGRAVCVAPERPAAISFPGERKGNHNIWITHHYTLHEGCYEYDHTDEDDIGTLM